MGGIVWAFVTRGWLLKVDFKTCVSIPLDFLQAFEDIICASWPSILLHMQGLSGHLSVAWDREWLRWSHNWCFHFYIPLVRHENIFLIHKAFIKWWPNRVQWEKLAARQLGLQACAAESALKGVILEKQYSVVQVQSPAFLLLGAKPGFLWLQLCHVDVPEALCCGREQSASLGVFQVCLLLAKYVQARKAFLQLLIKFSW